MNAETDDAGSDSGAGQDKKTVISYASEESNEFDSDVVQDDESVASSMDSGDSAGKTSVIPCEDWEYTPGRTRSNLLETVCDNKTSTDDLTVVQIAKRLKHFFLVVPDIISKGLHEGKRIAADSLFVMLQVDSNISIYDSNGKQICNDHTS